jgi:hypothetical protein
MPRSTRNTHPGGGRNQPPAPRASWVEVARYADLVRAFTRGHARGVAAVVCNPGEMLISLADSARGTRPGRIAERSKRKRGRLYPPETDRLTYGS